MAGTVFGSLPATSLSIVTLLIYAAMWITETITLSVKAHKRIDELEKVIRDLERDVSSVNSKLNLAIPDRNKSFNRST